MIHNLYQLKSEVKLVGSLCRPWYKLMPTINTQTKLPQKVKQVTINIYATIIPTITN